MTAGYEPRFPLFALARLRMATDGTGVTTLCAAHGCPLRCRLCLNPQSLDPLLQPEWLTPQQLYDRVKIDGLYFLATGGGVTFGGGEPLLHAGFLRAFRPLCTEWRLCAETSLNVPLAMVQLAAESIDHFYVDIKDMDPAIYQAYTGRSNAQVLENLAWLLRSRGPEAVTVRVPLIPGYNTQENVEKSLSALREMGVTQVDCFSYRIPGKTDGGNGTMKMNADQ